MVHVTLDVDGLEAADATDPSGRSWLTIAGSVRSRAGAWRFRHACLDVDEARQLAEWLGQLAQGVHPPHLSFTRPQLEFDAVTEMGDDAVRVSFALEARPTWRRNGDLDDDHPCFVDVATTSNELAEASADLLGALPAAQG